jgi:hypothetical protein
MKSALLLFGGVVLGFAVAHVVNSTPGGKRFLGGVNARMEDVRESYVEGFRTRNAEVRALAAEADRAASSSPTTSE